MTPRPTSSAAARAPTWLESRVRALGDVVRAGRKRPEATFFAVFAGLSALAVFVLVWFSTAREPIGVSDDSNAYISTAMSLQRGQGFRFLDGMPMVSWPPLYSMLLAAVQTLVRGHVLRAARVLNALCMAGTVAASAFWLMRNVLSTIARIVSLSALCVAPALVGLVALWAWSEMTFAALCALSLVALDRYVRSGTTSSLAVSALAASAAASTRYVGVSVVAVGSLIVLLMGTHRPLRRAIHAVCFGAVASLPLAAWLVRNHRFTGTWTGPRQALPPGTFWPTANEMLDVLGKICFPHSGPEPAMPPLVRGLLLSLLLAFFAAAIARAHGRGRCDLRPLAIPLVFIVTYLGVTAYALSTVKTDPVSERFLVPIYAPAAWVIGYALDSMRDFGPTRTGRVLRSMGVACLIVAMRGHVMELRRRVVAFRLEGGGWSGPQHRMAEVHLRNLLPAAGPLYSNCPEFLDIRSFRSAVFGPPLPVPQGWAAKGGHLVWFDVWADRPLTPPYSSERYREVVRVTGMTIYEIAPTTP